jgi:Arc/MetJ-type ribon-helix-helix transcriptional regulator
MGNNTETGIQTVGIKKIKSCRGHDGDAWSCDVYADGVKVALAANDGWGGEMSLDEISREASSGFVEVVQRLSRFAIESEVVREVNREWREKYPDREEDLYTLDPDKKTHMGQGVSISAIALVIEELLGRTETAKKLNKHTIYRDAEGTEWSRKVAYTEEVRIRIEKEDGAVWFANTDPRYQKPILMTL